MRLTTLTDDIELGIAHIEDEPYATATVEFTPFELVEHVGIHRPLEFDDDGLEEWGELLDSMMEHPQLAKLLVNYMEELRESGREHD